MEWLAEMNLERCRRDMAELAKFPVGARVRVIGPYAVDWPGEYIVVGAQYDHRHRGANRFNIWIATEEEISRGDGASTDLTPDELCVVDEPSKEVAPGLLGALEAITAELRSRIEDVGLGASDGEEKALAAAYAAIATAKAGSLCHSENDHDQR